MYKHPEKSSKPIPSESLIRDNVPSWLENRGIQVIPRIIGNEFIDQHWLQLVGIINQPDSLISTRIITSDFLGRNKNFGDGWFRGGAESFYKICEIIYETNGQVRRKLIAYKAIHSMGDITSKMITEAVWMAHMASLGLCAEVYAVGNGTIVKQFLEEDSAEQRLTNEEYSRQLSAIIEALRQAGLTPVSSTSDKIEVIQYQGRLMLIDLGSGDISGLDASTFIEGLD